jgi:hypothetical protein
VTVSILDLHCLNAVCDDYESLDSICEEVRRSSHGNVNRDEVADAILELSRDGLVEAFEFDTRAELYIAVRGVIADVAAKWFLITTKGRAELDANWVDS